MIETAKIRNVGVVGHGGVGKTSLVEALLFAAGALTRLGKVDDGSTTTDFDPDEIKRKISINTAVAGVQVQTEKIWKFASEYELARAIVINRLDRERADFYRTLESITRRLK